MDSAIIIGIGYRPPGMNRPEVYIHDLQEMLANVISTSYESINLLGDFNARCTEWNSPYNQSELNDDSLSTTTALGLHEIINKPTYITSTSANILDLMFTDTPAYVTDAGTLPLLGTSIHEVIYCECSKSVTRDKPYKKTIRHTKTLMERD